MMEEEYRGYRITAEPCGRKFVGLGVCNDSQHSPLTTQEYATPEAAIEELKRDIDYWLAPLWTRSLSAAQERIKELTAERDDLRAMLPTGETLDIVGESVSVNKEWYRERALYQHCPADEREEAEKKVELCQAALNQLRVIRAARAALQKVKDGNTETSN